MKKVVKAGLAAAAAGACVLAAADVLAARLVRLSVDATVDPGGLSTEIDHTHENDPAISTVTMESYDGTLLAGHLYPCDDPVRIVICMHGWHGTWLRDFAGTMDFLHDEGSIVLMPDQRGQNASGGRYMGFGLKEQYDCLEWIRWAEQNLSEDLPIYLYGISMGAATVMLAAGSGLPERVRGIIADCGFTSAQDVWAHMVKQRAHIPYVKLLRRLTEWHFARLTGTGGTDRSCAEALSECRVPALFIHGSDDRFVPVWMSRANYDACPSDKELVIIEGARHASSSKTDPAEYQAAIRRLWIRSGEQAAAQTCH